LNLAQAASPAKSLQEIYDAEFKKLIELKTAKNQDAEATAKQFEKTKQAKTALDEYNKIVSDTTKSLEGLLLGVQYTESLNSVAEKATQRLYDMVPAIDKITVAWIEGNKEIASSYGAIVENSALDELTKINEEMNNQVIQTDVLTEAIKLATDGFGAESEQVKKLQESLDKLNLEKANKEIEKLFGEDFGKQLEEAGYSVKQFSTDAVGAISDTTSALLTGQEGFAKSIGKLAFDMLEKLVPIWSAQILGYSMASAESVATFGAAGLAKWILLTGVLTGAVRAARSAAGFEEGGFTGDNIGTKEVAGVVHGKEFVANARTTQRERKLFEHLDKGGTSLDYFLNLPEIKQGSQYSNVYVNNDGMLERLDNMTHELRIIKMSNIDIAKKESKYSVNNKIVLKSDAWR